MEPYHVGGMDLEGGDTDPFPEDIDKMEEISDVLHKKINELHREIIQFKKKLYDTTVNENEGQNPQDIKSMHTFHALYLQCLAFLIGLLDNQPVPVLTLSETLEKEFQNIMNKVNVLLEPDSNPDANVLLYDLFFRLHAQHPFQLNMSK